MKLFTQVKQYTNLKGVRITKFKPNVDITIQSINLDTGDVEDKAILEYSKHENLCMYSVSSPDNLFEEFWVSKDHSLIVFDQEVNKYMKISPVTILEKPSRYSLVRGAEKVHISCLEVTIALAPSKTVGYDFTVADNFTFSTHDGVFVQDTMAVHIPISKESLHDVKMLMDGTKHVLNASDGSVAITPSHEMLIGLYKLTKIIEVEPVRKFRTLSSLEYLQQIDEVRVNERILFFDGKDYKDTCLGRLWVGNLLGIPIVEPLTKKSIKSVLSKSYDILGRVVFVEAMNDLKNLGFEWSTKLNFSLCIGDFKIPSTRDAKFKEAGEYAEQIESGDMTQVEKHSRIVRKWMDTIKDVQNDFLEEAGEDNNLVLMLNTGARASMSQVSQLTVAKGMLSDLSGEIIRNPIERNHTEGLDMIGYFRSMSGSRKGLADAKFSTPKTGYLTRRLVMAARDLYIVSSDCHTDEGMWVSNSVVKGRSVLESKDGWSKIRSPIFCKGKGGICKKCYGVDLSTRRRVVKNTAIGVIAGQSLSEPTTQMTLRTFHTSGAAELGDSPTVAKAKKAGIVKIFLGEFVSIVQVDEDSYYAHNIAEIVVSDGQMINVGEPLISYINAVRQEDVTNKVPILETYFEVNTPKIEAVVARVDGTVRIGITDEGVIQLFIEEECQGEVLDQTVFVYDGEWVRKGQFLSYGEAGLRKLWNATHDLELLSTVFVSRLSELYQEEGVSISRIHFEVIFRALTEIVEKSDGSFGLRMFDEGTILLKGSNQVGGTNPSWLKAVAFGWTKSNLSVAAAMNRISYDLPTERILTGERLPRRSQDFA
jgi:hypothetical protein